VRGRGHEALKSHRHLRSPRVMRQADGLALTWNIIRDHVQRAIRRAHLGQTGTSGIHRLRHTFCSHLAMRGARRGRFRSLLASRISRRPSGTCI
jgi:site-specific recombinase XerD